MNSSIESHEPSPEFRARLEWQIATALRRDSRFATPVPTRHWRLIAAFAVVLAFVAGGMAGVTAMQAQDARQKSALLEAARAEEKLVRARLELANEQYQTVRVGFEAGTTGRETLLTAEATVRTREAELERIQLDIEEIQTTAAAPRNELTAPLVNQRDFVRSRLMIEARLADQKLVEAEQRMERVDQLAKVGVVPPSALLRARTELEEARFRVGVAQAALAERDRSLRTGATAQEATSRLRQAELTLNQTRARREIEITRERVDALRKLVAVGTATQLDLKRAEVELLEQELELQRLGEELKTLTPAGGR
ncbi:MAG TPA: hypothetical protein VFV95_08350 [Vicinamibacterales bacterium]|nr:hypothetical protein [Vicinamibacterales bacterium]